MIADGATHRDVSDHQDFCAIDDRATQRSHRDDGSYFGPLVDPDAFERLIASREKINFTVDRR